jgi:hypothetical protein
MFWRLRVQKPTPRHEQSRDASSGALCFGYERLQRFAFDQKPKAAANKFGVFQNGCRPTTVTKRRYAAAADESSR